MSVKNPLIGTFSMIFGIFVISWGVFRIFTGNLNNSTNLIYIMPIIGSILILFGYILYGKKEIIIDKNGIRLTSNIGNIGYFEWKSLKAVSNGKEFIGGYYIKIIEEGKLWSQYNVGGNETLKKELIYIFNEIINKQSIYKFRIIDKENWKKGNLKRPEQKKFSTK